MQPGSRRIAVTAFILVTLAALWAVFQLPNIQFDYDFEKFFPEGDPDTEYYQAHRERFPTDNDFVLIGLERSEGIFHRNFLRKAEALADTIRNHELVSSVISPGKLEYIVRDPLFGSPVRRPYLNVNKPDQYRRDSIRIYNDPELVPSLFSENGKSLTLVVNHQQNISKKKADQLADFLRSVTSQADFEEIHLAGRSIGQSHYVKLIQEELQVFLLISIGVLVLFLSISFRTVWGVFIPLLIVMLAVLMTLALMISTGQKISLLLNVLPPILFVVGISDVVHILTRYIEALRNKYQPYQALKLVFREVGMATFLTSITTAIGFLTLILINLEPLEKFGIFTAAGVIIAFILAFTLLPSVLAFTPYPKIAQKPYEETVWYRIMRGAFRFTLRRWRFLVVAGAFTMIGGALFIPQLEVDNYLLEDLKQDDPLKKDFVYFEETHSGVRPVVIELQLRNRANSFFDREVLQELETVQSYLTSEYGLNAVQSPVNLAKRYNQSFNGGSLEAYQLPENESRYRKMRSEFNQLRNSGKIKGYLDSTLQYARISGRIEDLGNRIISARNDDFREFLSQKLPDRKLEYRVTGTAHLVDRSNDYMASNLIQGLIAAVLVVALITGILHKSWRMIIITLLPNILPLILTAVTMVILNIDLKISTGIIFTMAFGIAVDDTIHFTSKLRHELRRGKSMIYAVKRTFISTGKGIVVTSVILFGGFISLTFSNFMSTFYIGVLVTLTLFYALIADLLFLPALVYLFFGKRGLNKPFNRKIRLNKAPASRQNVRSGTGAPVQQGR